MKWLDEWRKMRAATAELERLEKWVNDNRSLIGTYKSSEKATIIDDSIEIMKSLGLAVDEWEGKADGRLRAKFYSLSRKVEAWWPRSSANDIERVESCLDRFIHLMSGDTVNNSVVAEFLKEITHQIEPPPGRFHYVAYHEGKLTVFIFFSQMDVYPMVPTSDHDWRHPKEVAAGAKERIEKLQKEAAERKAVGDALLEHRQLEAKAKSEFVAARRLKRIENDPEHVQKDPPGWYEATLKDWHESDELKTIRESAPPTPDKED